MSSSRSLLLPAALCALAAAAAAAAPASAPGGDFIDSVTGQAAMKTEADAESCQKEAEAQLAGPRALLQKKCEEAGGQFNTGLPALSLHRASCSVYQTVTCSGTPGSQTQADKAQTDKPEGAKDDAALPPPSPLPAHKSPARKKKLKKAPISSQASANPTN